MAYAEDGTATLTIQKSTAPDEGNYQCIAENHHDTANSIADVKVRCVTKGRARRQKQIKLKEGEPPKFDVQLEVSLCRLEFVMNEIFQGCKLNEGSSVKFRCKVTGKPAPTVKW
jgi:hypothetical protein